jgi:hypothetical protein
VYAQRAADETFHDYASVTVTSLDPVAGCTGDLDGSGTVDGTDLGMLLSAWGACPGCVADLDGNGVVDGGDLGPLLSAWGACP